MIIGRQFLTAGLALLVLAVLAQPGAAEVARHLSRTCVEGAATRTISGVPVYKSCWRYRNTYEVSLDSYDDYCAPLASTCRRTGTTCRSTSPDGKCAQYVDSYICEDPKSTSSHVRHTGTQREITGDYTDTSACNAFANSDSCSAAGNRTCTAGAATRTINGLPVYKDCWEWRQDYTCVGAGWVSNCENISESCRPAGTVCLSRDAAGTCLSEELQYECTKPAEPASVEAITCGPSSYCLDGSCDAFDENPDNDFAKAVLYLNILKGIQEELDPGAPDVFSAEAATCKRDVIGVNNCCNEGGSGVFNPIFGCTPAEEQLWNQVDAGLTHYVGTYCSSKTLGVCTRKRKSYCVFDSKLGRIIQEGGRPQLGRDWGTPEEPDCSGLAPEDLQHIDFSQMDFSDVYAEMYENISIPDISATTEFVEEKVQSYYDQSY